MRLLLGLTIGGLAFAEGDVEKLGWLAGCWEMRAGTGMVIEEMWTRPAGGTMLGVGRTVKGGRTVFSEFMKVGEVGGKLTYTARIGTKGVTDFPLKQLGVGAVVFENLGHDFPQRIIYKKAGEGVVARIEGVEKGVAKGEDFGYRRVRCEGRGN